MTPDVPEWGMKESDEREITAYQILALGIVWAIQDQARRPSAAARQLSESRLNLIQESKLP